MTKQREAFERWAKNEFPGLEIRRQNLLGTYTKTITEWLHTGWQAAQADKLEFARHVVEIHDMNSFKKWFSDYHDTACKEYGGIDCTDPKGIAEDAWEAGRAALRSGE